ncbi:MAG: hypothetical protein MJE77_47125, partial [Proteobacteria bacterium]|nr:hypothetical protein [Pseudomonadota bacterium]
MGTAREFFTCADGAIAVSATARRGVGNRAIGVPEGEHVSAMPSPPKAARIIETDKPSIGLD